MKKQLIHIGMTQGRWRSQLGCGENRKSYVLLMSQPGLRLGLGHPRLGLLLFIWLPLMSAVSYDVCSLHHYGCHSSDYPLSAFSKSSSTIVTLTNADCVSASHQPIYYSASKQSNGGEGRSLCWEFVLPVQTNLACAVPDTYVALIWQFTISFE